MKLKNIYFSIFLLINLSIFAQNTTTPTLKKPVSIYTFSNLLNSKNDFSDINKKLKLNNFNFAYLDLNDSDANPYSLRLRNFGKTPTAFIYDDYIAYRDENLLKGFLLENDPTRWNLWCPSPLSVQPTE
ncbi:hypothetical protein [Polaribacter sp. Hel_I_88]|uniref:hypothetical protein n=1 Tax=Polaribacter sp. Hel_I_88 TaxID=1250006 RepID=UPI000B0AA01F|nr:hypothetical protein [Polaribacter sp. Hel_I_88]